MKDVMKKQRQARRKIIRQWTLLRGENAMVWISVRVKLEIGVQHGPRYASYIPLSLLSFQTQCRGDGSARRFTGGAPRPPARTSRDPPTLPLERSCRQSLWWRFPKAVSHAIERINHVEGIVDCYEFLA